VVGKLGTMLVHANASTGPRTKAGAGDRTCACASFPCMGDVPQGSYLNSEAPLHFQGLGQPTTVNRQPPTANRLRKCIRSCDFRRHQIASRMRAGREGLPARFPRAFWWPASLLSTAEALRRRAQQWH